jgi:hypothetical protein
VRRNRAHCWFSFSDGSHLRNFLVSESFDEHGCNKLCCTSPNAGLGSGHLGPRDSSVSSRLRAGIVSNFLDEVGKLARFFAPPGYNCCPQNINL